MIQLMNELVTTVFVDKSLSNPLGLLKTRKGDGSVNSTPNTTQQKNAQPCKIYLLNQYSYEGGGLLSFIIVQINIIKTHTLCLHKQAGLLAGSTQPANNKLVY